MVKLERNINQAKKTVGINDLSPKHNREHPVKSRAVLP